MVIISLLSICFAVCFISAVVNAISKRKKKAVLAAVIMCVSLAGLFAVRFSPGIPRTNAYCEQSFVESVDAVFDDETLAFSDHVQVYYYLSADEYIYSMIVTGNNFSSAEECEKYVSELLPKYSPFRLVGNRMSEKLPGRNVTVYFYPAIQSLIPPNLNWLKGGLLDDEIMTDFIIVSETAYLNVSIETPLERTLPEDFIVDSLREYLHPSPAEPAE